MYSKYNRFRLSTCLHVFAFGALISLPAHAGFEWTPPDEAVPSTVITNDSFADDGMGSDFLIMDDNDDLFLGEKPNTANDTQTTDINEMPEALDVEPPIEIKILEESDYRVEKSDPIAVKAIPEAEDAKKIKIAKEAEDLRNAEVAEELRKSKEAEELKKAEETKMAKEAKAEAEEIKKLEDAEKAKMAKEAKKAEIEAIKKLAYDQINAKAVAIETVEEIEVEAPPLIEVEAPLESPSPIEKVVKEIIAEDPPVFENVAPEPEYVKSRGVVLDPRPAKKGVAPPPPAPARYNQAQDIIDDLAAAPVPEEVKIELQPTAQIKEVPVEIILDPSPTTNDVAAPTANAESIQENYIIEELVIEAEPEASAEMVLEPYPAKEGVAPPPPPLSADAADVQWNKGTPEYNVIEGFGKEMPMALALSQIVPPEFSYFFGKGVNPGSRISWNGGKPWNKVLNEALAPLNVRAFINEQKIIIRSTNPLPKKPEPKAKDSFINIKKDLPKVKQEDAAIINAPTEAPEQAMIAALAQKELVIEPHPEEAVILDKTAMQNNNLAENNQNSALVNDLMKPLNTYEEEANNASTQPPILFKPEIILDEQEQAEEDYANKLEKTNPFNSQPTAIELVAAPVTSIDDAPKEASHEGVKPPPLDISLDDAPAEISAASNVEEDKAVAANIGAVEPSSNFREGPSNKIRVWQAYSGKNLQKIMEDWSAKERVALTWNSTERYVLDYDVFISGTYKNAINILFDKGLKQAPEYKLSEAPYKIIVLEDED